MSLHIYIDTIPHAEQRYPTVGDYWEEPGREVFPTRHEIRVSEMQNRDYEFLVALHELVEMYLCLKHGISEESITAFDKDFEANRMPGNFDEPGFDSAAPYYEEHKFATVVEKAVAAELGVNWDHYDTTVNEL
jgi:hypothetical protein